VTAASTHSAWPLCAQSNPNVQHNTTTSEANDQYVYLCVCPLREQLPYLVGNIVEILELKDDDDIEDDGANVDLDSHRKGKCTVIKTSTRQTIFLPVVGLVDPEKLEPGDLVGVNKDSYLILDTLPCEYDSRVKAMEVDEKPSEEYSDIGGLDKQIQELVEALVLPLTHKDRFESIGIRAPKGVLLYGPPGTGKTLMARACAAQTNACFLKLAGPQLVQMFIGDGAKLVRDAFALAKEKSGPVFSLALIQPALLNLLFFLNCASVLLMLRSKCLCVKLNRNVLAPARRSVIRKEWGTFFSTEKCSNF